MFFYTTGDLLQSDAEALVNTVNCEGYMGKGIAYQFKLKFPNNNKDYVKACKMVHSVPEHFTFIRKAKKSLLISQLKINGVRNHGWNILRRGWMRLFY